MEMNRLFVLLQSLSLYQPKIYGRSRGLPPSLLILRLDLENNRIDNREGSIPRYFPPKYKEIRMKAWAMIGVVLVMGGLGWMMGGLVGSVITGMIGVAWAETWLDAK